MIDKEGMTGPEPRLSVKAVEAQCIPDRERAHHPKLRSKIAIPIACGDRPNTLAVVTTVSRVWMLSGRPSMPDRCHGSVLRIPSRDLFVPGTFSRTWLEALVDPVRH
jgi:hypothetical protein